MSSIHNELRRAGAIIGGIKTAVGSTDSESGVERFSETLQPIMDIWSRPEWARLHKERLFWGRATQAGVAAELSMCGIENAVGTGQLVVLERILIPNLTGAGDNYDLRFSRSILADFAGSQTDLVTRDLRHFDNSVRADMIQQTGGAAIGVMAGFVQIQAGVTLPVELDLVLQPGSQFFVIKNTVNTQLIVDFFGYEREALPGEL